MRAIPGLPEEKKGGVSGEAETHLQRAGDDPQTAHLRCPICASGTRSRIMRQASYTMVEGSNCIVFTTLPMLIFSERATMVAAGLSPLLCHLLRTQHVRSHHQASGHDAGWDVMVFTPLQVPGGGGGAEPRAQVPTQEQVKVVENSVRTEGLQMEFPAWPTNAERWGCCALIVHPVSPSGLCSCTAVSHSTEEMCVSSVLR